MKESAYGMKAMTAIIVSILLWVSIVSLPLILTHGDLYKRCFAEEYYDVSPHDYWNSEKWPSAVGLTLGITAVAVGQVFTLLYFCLWKQDYIQMPKVAIQKAGVTSYNLKEGIISHLAQPEGLVMLGSYLTITWMFGLMPQSYYSFSGGIDWIHVALQLLIQDLTQYLMHLVEHRASAVFYQVSHKPHHRFTNPKMFDAFNGSILDTFFMILVPLVVTSRLVNANVWSYMAFGSLYANWLVLIHAEYSHPWDPIFRKLGFGTSGDHHVHHKLFKYNFAHLFMYWDRLCGTYKSPTMVPLFNKDLI